MKHEFELIRSPRRTLAIQVTDDLRVVVRAPLSMKRQAVEDFVDGQSAWIEKHLDIARARQADCAPALTHEELVALGQAAREDLARRVAHFAPLVGVTVGSITIRNQKTRWGSCSAKGNLNFNCLLMLCPQSVRDYVVVHELCHRRELNHSPRFWALVEEFLPDYSERRAWLKQHGGAIMGRVSPR